MPSAPDITLAALREAISALEPDAPSRRAGLFQLGLPAIDAFLGGGLARGAVHEVYAGRAQDAAAASGFGLGLGIRAAGGRPLVWSRQDFVDVETGGLYGDGLAAFGLNPERLLVVRARDPTGALRAAAEALRCSAIGTTLVEIWGEPKVLDSKASRRLALAAGASGATLVMIRLGAAPAPSAATSRWSVSTSASTPLEANAPGSPAFDVALLRHRAGFGPRAWRLEWNRERASFEFPPLSRSVVSPPADRPAAAVVGTPWKRAG